MSITFKLLIVDDEPEIAEELAEFLRFHDIAATCASDGSQALRLISQEYYSHLILDLRMPGLSGFEVLEVLQKRGKTYPQVAVISGHATPEDENTALALGAAFFFSKPFDPEAILRSGFFGEAGSAIEEAQSSSYYIGQVFDTQISPDLDLWVEVLKVVPNHAGEKYVTFNFRIIRNGSAIVDSGVRTESLAVFQHLINDPVSFPNWPLTQNM